MMKLLCILLFFLSLHLSAIAQIDSRIVDKILDDWDSSINIDRAIWDHALKIKEKTVLQHIIKASMQDSMLMTMTFFCDKQGFQLTRKEDISMAHGKGSPLEPTLLASSVIIYSYNDDHSRQTEVKREKEHFGSQMKLIDSTIITLNEEAGTKNMITYTYGKRGYYLSGDYTFYFDKHKNVYMHVHKQYDGKYTHFDTTRRHSYTYDDKGRLKTHFIKSSVFDENKVEYLQNYSYEGDSIIRISINSNPTESQLSSEMILHLTKDGKLIRKTWTRGPGSKYGPLKLISTYTYNDSNKLLTKLSWRDETPNKPVKVEMEKNTYSMDGFLEKQFCYKAGKDGKLDLNAAPTSTLSNEYTFYVR